MGLKKLTLAMINVRDYQAMKDFYSKVLGLEIAEEADQGQWATFKLPQGDAEIAIHGGLPPATGTGYPAVIPCVEVAGITETIEELRARGVEIANEVHPGTPGLLLADIKDPEGNWINLYEGVE